MAYQAASSLTLKQLLVYLTLYSHSSYRMTYNCKLFQVKVFAYVTGIVLEVLIIIENPNTQ